MIQHFFYNENGQTLVEYGLLIALIALVSIGAISLFTAKLKSALYDKAVSQLTS